MSTNPRLYLATIVYSTAQSETRSIEVAVMAIDERDAIRAATNAVRQLLPDADIIGGALEYLEDAPAEAPERSEASDARGLTAPTVPASRTVH
jgi:hypothetical protein